MKNYIMVFLLFVVSPVLAQQNKIDSIVFFADIVANAELSTSRVLANKHLIKLVESYLSDTNFQKIEMMQIAHLSALETGDKKLLVISWQLVEENNKYLYFGYIKSTKGNVIKLHSQPDVNLKEALYDRYEPNDWLGALYYNIKDTKFNNKPAYLLFGYNGFDGNSHRKYVDLLYFENDRAYFGGEIFRQERNERRDKIQSRVIIEYSNTANVSLNFNENLDLILYDHLISRISDTDGGSILLLPDGSYEGYKWDGNYWNHITKVFDHVRKHPPRDSKKKNTTSSLFDPSK